MQTVKETNMYRVWPDLDTQYVEDNNEEPYSWKSDDYLEIQTDSEEEAIIQFNKLTGN